MNNESPFNQTPGGNPYQPQQPPVNPYAAPMMDGRSMSYEPDFGMQQDYVLASRGTRFLGALIDGLVMMVAIVPALFIFAPDFLEHFDEDKMLMAVIIPVLLVSIVQWVLIATSGQSIAKKLLGMKIVKLDGSDVGFVHGVILRIWVVALMGAIPFVGNFVGLIDALMIFGDDNRCLHDRVASTRVIVV